MRRWVPILFFALPWLGGGAGLWGQTWDGGGANDRWNTRNNWNPNTTPSFNNATDLVFDGSIRTSPDMNGNRTVNSVAFAAGAASFSLLGTAGGGNETLKFAGSGAGIVQQSANAQTMVMNRLRWNANGTIDITGAGALTIGNGAAASGEFYGSADVTKTGTGGALVLNADNSNWTGALTIGQGVVEARTSGGALGAGAVTVASGATLNLGTGGLTFANGVSLGGDGVGGAGALRNVAASGTNAVSGALALTADARVAADAGGTLVLSGDLTGAGRTLTAAGAGNITISGQIATGAGGLVKEGAGVLRLTSPIANTFTGPTTITAGSIITAASNQFNNAAALTVGNGTLLSLNDFTQTVGSLSGGGTVDFGAGGTGQLILSGGAGVFDGVFSGTGELVIRAGATLTLGANFNAPNVTITLAGGTLNLNGSTSTFGELNITGDSLLDFGSSVASLLTVQGVVFQNTGLQLSVQNWVEMVDYFYAQNFAGATPGVSGATPQNQIAFTGFSNNDTAWLAFDQQIMPVPEPGLYGAVLIAFAGALAMGRRRRCAQ
jgi:autotransporter-associated beta strand protein